MFLKFDLTIRDGFNASEIGNYRWYFRRKTLAALPIPLFFHLFSFQYLVGWVFEIIDIGFPYLCQTRASCLCLKSWTLFETISGSLHRIDCTSFSYQPPPSSSSCRTFFQSIFIKLIILSSNIRSEYYFFVFSRRVARPLTSGYRKIIWNFFFNISPFWFQLKLQNKKENNGFKKILSIFLFSLRYNFFFRNHLAEYLADIRINLITKIRQDKWTRNAIFYSLFSGLLDILFLPYFSSGEFFLLKSFQRY